MEKPKTEEEGYPWALIVPVLLSVAWFIVLFILLAFADKGDCLIGVWYLLYASCLTPNEVGDLLAGAFAPVAFFWVAAAVFIQSQELKAQRLELRETRRFAEEQARASQEQVAALRHEETDQFVFAELNRVFDRLIDLELPFEGPSGKGTFRAATGQQLEGRNAKNWQWVAQRLNSFVRNSANGQYVLLANEGATKMAAELDQIGVKCGAMSAAGQATLETYSVGAITSALKVWGIGTKRPS